MSSNPKLSAFCLAAPLAPASQDIDPSDRSDDRLLARLGLLEDVSPLFGSASAVARAGVLLALPILIASGVFDCARKVYSSLGPGFYGLRTSLLTRIPRARFRPHTARCGGRKVSYVLADQEVRLLKGKLTLRLGVVRLIVQVTTHPGALGRDTLRVEDHGVVVIASVQVPGQAQLTELAMHWIPCALALAFPSTGKSIPARIAMIAIITRSSMSVKPVLAERFIPFEVPTAWDHILHAT